MKQIIPSLWFADNNCEEAVNYYMEVFPDSKILELIKYPDESLDPHFTGMAGKVIAAVFELKGQTFSGLDGGPAFRFSEAISFTIECEDQAEIDHYWSRLSHVPEAEQCGWCKDRYGLSWQIVPYNMGELIQSNDQIQAMMKMKKIEITALESAGSSS